MSEPTSLEGYGALFTRTLDLSALATEKLAGQSFPLPGGGSIAFSGNCRIKIDLPNRLIAFIPAATATVGGLIGRANVSGAKLSQDLKTVKPLIDGLPDVITIELR